MNMNQQYVSWTVADGTEIATTSAVSSQAGLFIQSPSVAITPPIQRSSVLDASSAIGILQDASVASSLKLAAPLAEHRTELVFIEGNVADYQQLVASIGAGKEVHLLDASKDGLQQIASVLEGRSNIDALHLISHGSNGTINLGALNLNSSNLSDHSQTLETIGNALSKDADILLYGCDVAQQDDHHFLDSLAVVTGADIAASNNLTGAAQADGDWNLEVHTGNIESAVAVDPQLAALYSHVLNIASATITFTATSNNILSVGSKNNASTDFLYKVNGDTNYQFKIDGATRGVYEYVNPGQYVLLDAGVSNETSVTFSFKDNNVFSANSIYIANYDPGVVSQNLEFRGYDSSNSLVGSIQQFTTTSTASDFNKFTFSGLTNITKLVLTANGTNSNFLRYLAIDNLALSNIQAAVTAPTISSVTQSSGDGYYNVNNSNPVLISVTFDQAVTVNTGGGTPRLQLETGTVDEYANYVSGSGTNVLTFSYLVQAGDTSADLEYLSTAALSLNGGTIKLTSDGTTAATLTLPALGSGSSLAGSSAIIIDTTAPSGSTPDLAAGSDSGSSSTDNITSDTTPTFTGSTEANATVTLFDTDGTTQIGSTTADGSGNWSITASALSEGTHTIYTKVTDLANNTSSLSTSLDITIDTTAPAIGTPDLMPASDSGVSSSDNLTNKTTPNFNGTAEASATVTLFDTDGTTVLGTTTANGMGKWTITSSLLSEGAHMVSAKATDAAGNISSASSKLTVTIDTTAPVTSPDAPTLDSATDSGVSNSDQITNLSGPCFLGTGADANSWVNVYADGTLLGTTQSDGSGNYAYSATFLADGVHAITAKNVDNAGNIGPTSSSLSITIDTNTPTTTIASIALSNDTGTSSTDFITNTAAQTISGTTSANIVSSEIVEVSLDNGSTWTTASTSVGSNSWSLSGQTLVSSNTLQVRVSDLAGNANTSASQAYVLDTTAPTTTIATLSFSADTGSSSTDFITKTAAQTISGTTSANLISGEIVEVSLDNGSTWTTATTSVGNNTWSLSGQTLTSSDTLQVRVSDVAGNSSAAASQAYVLDTTAPTTTIATLSFSADTGSSSTDFITKTAAQTISGTTSANIVSGETVEVSLDNGSTWTTATTSVGSNTWSLSGQTLTSSNTLKVRVTDTAGNTGTVVSQAFVLDTTAPTTTISTLAFSADTGSSSTDFITKTAAQTISGTTSANIGSGEIVEVSLDNGSTWTTASASVGSNTWSLSGQTLTGSDTLRVRVTDTAGNSSVAASQAYVLDTTAPTTTIATLAFSADTGSSSTDFITKTAAQTISGTTSANIVSGEIVEVSLDNGSTWTTATTSVGNNTWSLSGQTLTSSDTLQVRVSDVAGNSSATASQAYVLDTTAPTTTIATLSFSADTGSSSTDFITKTAAQTISGTTSANIVSGETVEVSLDNGSTWTTATTSVGSNTWSLSGQTLTSSNTLKVRVTDTAGNTGTVASQAYVLDTTAPTTTISTLAFSADTGSSSTDFITKTAAQTISGTTSANLISGEIVEVSLDNGSTWATATTSVGSNTWSLSGQTLTSSDTLQVRVSDVAGNSSAATSQVYVLDTTAPTTTIATLSFSADTGSSSSDFITNTAAQTVSGTTSANLISGEIVEVSLDNGSTWTTATTSVGNNTWSLSGQTLTSSDTLRVRVSDVAGNSSAVASQAYVLDQSAPSAPSAPDLTAGSDTGISNTDDITSDTTPTLTGTTEANATVTLFDTDGTTQLGTAVANGGGNWTITSLSLGNGAHTLTTKATDAAGNISVASTGLVVTIDTTTPAAPSVADLSAGSDSGTSSTDNTTSVTTPTFTGTAEANATVTLFDTDGTTQLGSATADGSGNWTITSSALSDGAHTLTTTATNTIGNTSVASTGLVVTIDTSITAPATADLSAASDSGASNSDNITIDTTPTLTGTTEANANVILFDTDGTTQLGTATADGSGNWTITSTALSEGTHTLTTKATDLAGNVSTASAGLSVTIDSTTPAAPSVADLSAASDSGTSNTDNITNNTTPTLTGTAEANASITLFDTDGTTQLGTVSADGAGNWTITSSALSSGAHTLTTKATDAAGNVSAASSGLPITIDSVAPTLNITSNVANLKVGETATITFTFNEDPSTTFSWDGTSGDVVVSGGTLGAISGSGLTRTALFTPTAATNSGTASITVAGGTYTDTAGNSGGAGTTPTLNFDTLAPSAPSAPDLDAASDTGVSNSDNLTADDTPTFSGTAEANAAITLFDTNGTTQLGTATADGGGNWSITSTTLANGVHTVTAKATDAAGNVSVASGSLSVTIDVPPVADPAVVSTIDGIQLSTVTTIDATTGIANAVITIPTITNSRIEDPATPNRLLADIPLGIQSSAGNTTLTVSLPVNFGLQADGATRLLSNSEAQRDLTARINQNTTTGSETQTNLQQHLHDFLSDLNSQTVIQSRELTFTSTPGGSANDAPTTLFINSVISTSPLVPLPLQATALALLLDTHQLNANTIIQANDVDFITVVGNINLQGEGRPHFVVGDDASQHIFLSSPRNQIFAGAGTDVIGSAGGNDLLDGGSGNDIVVGGGGDDMVIGGTGNDVITGGGSDEGQWNFYLGSNGIVGQHSTAIFAPQSSEAVAAIALRQNLSDFAFLHADNTQLTNLALLYQAAFGRIADLDGFNYWLNSGANIKTIANQFLLSNEWASSGQAQLSDSAFIQNVYAQALGRSPDPAGLAYWLAQLAANPGNSGRADVLSAIAVSVEHLNRLTTSDGLALVEQNVTQERGWIAGSGDDILNGGAGNDIIQGGDGTDTLVYDGAQNDYRVRVSLDGQVHIEDSRNGDLDTISNIERASFGNTSSDVVNTAIDFSFTEAAPDTLRTIGLLYQSLFDRAADLDGLRYWLSQSGSQAANAQILANQFVQTTEFIADFNTLSQSQFVQALFRNTGLQSDAAGGEAFWENYLTTHTRAELIATWIHNDTVIQTLAGSNGIWVA